MNTSLIAEASKKYSGLALNHYYQQVDKVFQCAPLYISERMSILVRKDISPDDIGVNVVMGGFSPAEIRHTEWEDVEHKLKFRAVEEPISVTDGIISDDLGFQLDDWALANCAYRLGKDLFVNLDTILTTAGNFTGREIDLAGGGYVKWNVPATAIPRDNILALKQTLSTETGVDDDDPRITLILSQNAYRYVLATTQYKDYATKIINASGMVDTKQTMRLFFEVPNVVVLPATFFDDVVVLTLVESPVDSLAIANANMNISGILTGAYNLASVNQPIEYTMTNGVKVMESRAFLGARIYERPDKIARHAQAFTWNTIFVHNEDALTRLKNID